MSKKTVAVKVDERVLKSLRAASQSLGELASSAIVAAENLAKPRR